MAPHIALHEIGAAFDIRPISLARREQRDPAYLALNPEGKVPTLLVDGRALTEVAGILFYLARSHPAAGLLPNGDAEAEARIVAWMSFLAATVHPARRQGIDHATAAWAIAEARLARRRWAVGDRMSIADIHLFRLFWRFRGGAEDAAAGFPWLVDHHARMLARPAVQRTIAVESAIGYELPA